MYDVVRIFCHCVRVKFFLWTALLVHSLQMLPLIMLHVISVIVRWVHTLSCAKMAEPILMPDSCAWETCIRWGVQIILWTGALVRVTCARSL